MVFDVPPQDVITRDNVSVKVNAVVYFRVIDPQKSIIQVANFLEATSQLSQTTLRSVLGKHELDELLSEREQLNADIQQVLDAQTDAWGIKVSTVEIKHVDLNETMVRAIARQAEAERERRAKVIHAEGELQASEKLLAAAEMLSRRAEAMQLRYLQTLTQIAGEGMTIVFRAVDVSVRSGVAAQAQGLSGDGEEHKSRAVARIPSRSRGFRARLAVTAGQIILLCAMRWISSVRAAAPPDNSSLRAAPTAPVPDSAERTRTTRAHDVKWRFPSTARWRICSG